MKTWQTSVLAGLGLTALAALTVAAGPLDGAKVQAVAALDASGNGSARGVWIVAGDGSVKYCMAEVSGVRPGGLPPPICSPWTNR